MLPETHRKLMFAAKEAGFDTLGDWLATTPIPFGARVDGVDDWDEIPAEVFRNDLRLHAKQALEAIRQMHELVDYRACLVDESANIEALEQLHSALASLRRLARHARGASRV